MPQVSPVSGGLKESEQHMMILFCIVMKISCIASTLISKWTIWSHFNTKPFFTQTTLCYFWLSVTEQNTMSVTLVWNFTINGKFSDKYVQG